jgi:hypothetical protein
VLQARKELRDDLPLIVDAVRTVDQLSALRGGASLLHLHLTAADAVLKRRYEGRRSADSGFEFASYAAVRANATEMGVENLARFAALVLDTGALDIAATRSRVVRLLRAAGRKGNPGEAG